MQTIWPGSAAAASQIACFDELVTLDGLSLNPQSGRSLSEQELRERMAGALGSSLTLSLRKPADQGSRVYVVNLVRSSLEMQRTFNSLFPAVSERRIIGPVALRLVLDGEVIYAVGKMRKLLCTLMKGAQERALSTWKSHVEVCQQVRAKVEKTTQRLVNKSQFYLRALQTWRAPVHRTATLSRKLARWFECERYKLNFATWARWSLHTIHARIDRAITTKIRAKSRLRSLSGGFLGLRCIDGQGAVLSAADLRYSTALRRRCLAGWRQLRWTQQQFRQVCKKVARRWRYLDAARPFCTWHARVREDAGKRRLLLRLTSRTDRKVLLTIFVRFSDVIAGGLQTLDACAFMLPYATMTYLHARQR